MNKKNIQEKQLELRTWLKKIGLSQNEFAAIFLEETYEYVTDEEIEKFQESFKKQLTRIGKGVKSLLDSFNAFL